LVYTIIGTELKTRATNGNLTRKTGNFWFRLNSLLQTSAQIYNGGQQPNPEAKLPCVQKLQANRMKHRNVTVNMRKTG
jgi:hypothetical protein